LISGPFISIGSEGKSLGLVVAESRMIVRLS